MAQQVGLAGLLALVALATGCTCRGSRPGSGCASGVKALRVDIQRGMSVAHNYQAAGRHGYGTQTSAGTLLELQRLGVNWVSLTPFGFMTGLESTDVIAIGEAVEGETDERMQREIAEAKRLGLRVFLKPQIWIRGGRWRGDIAYADAAAWDAWFASYAQWILHYADMAQTLGVEMLAVGVEFKASAIAAPERWRALVKEVRARYEGKLVYCANWDAFADIGWWDALDFIGVQFYVPLAERGGSAVSQLGKRLDPELTKIGQVSQRFGKSVLFTEVGYRSVYGSAVTPHGWPERDGAPRPDGAEQARAYRAFLAQIDARPWVKGVYWWKWFTDPNTNEEGATGFSPRQKPAEAVLRAAYGGVCAR